MQYTATTRTAQGVTLATSPVKDTAEDALLWLASQAEVNGEPTATQAFLVRLAVDGVFYPYTVMGLNLYSMDEQPRGRNGL